MNSFSRISTLFGSNKTNAIYSSYKYDDIKPEWIIHEGNLEYLYNETILKFSLFKKYIFVLTCILNDKKENTIVLYLYPDKTKNPYKYFQLEQNDTLNDRCRKVIVGKAGFFFLELIINKGDKSEIFAARSVPERELWIQKFNEAISKMKSKFITRSVSDAQSIRPKPTTEECASSDGSHPINYEAFEDDELKNPRQSSISLPTDLSARRFSIKPNIVQPMSSINDYDEAKVIPPTDLNENEGICSWDEIFYNNINNDFTNVLNNIGQTGVFLVRPQSNKLYSNDHDYTLCVYDNGHIHKFGIHHFPDDQYLLTYREGEPHFIDIPHLCQYYTNHPLHITSKEGVNKSISLTFPYTHANLYY